MKICDLTQFYAPSSGGVKRYLHEKIAYVESATADEHVLIVPDREASVTRSDRSVIYRIASPATPGGAGYRLLVDLRALGEILAREKPDLIESSDPYQLAWKAISAGRALNVPVVGFYHSHFAESYLRSASTRFGKHGSEKLVELGRRYTRMLYNRFAATLVPSESLADVLRDWGVKNIRTASLGVNTDVFRPDVADREATRKALRVEADTTLLLYTGRLAPDKNTRTLFKAFEILRCERQRKFHLLVIGDGPERELLRALLGRNDDVTWLPYCSDSAQLSRYYRAADLFVHPGVEETFGLVALESQACGTPVVGIRGSNMDRVIFHDQQAWAVENSAPALVESINRQREANLRELGALASRAATAQLAWPHVFERIFSIYRELIAAHATPRR